MEITFVQCLGVGRGRGLYDLDVCRFPFSFLSLLPSTTLPLLPSSRQVEECLVCSEMAASILFKPCLHMVACESELTLCIPRDKAVLEGAAWFMCVLSVQVVLL